MEEKRKTESEEEIISEDALKKAEKYIEEEEGPSRRLSGKTDLFVTAVAVGMSLFHLYSAAGIVMTQILRGIHVMFVLFLTFLVFPSMKGLKNRILWIDVLLSLLGIAVVAYMLVDFEDFIYRSVVPTFWDQFFGIILILLVLEATRRTSGWIMPAIVIAFLVYAMVGQELPKPWTHRGYDIGRIVGHMYMTLEGIFGVPIDVSSTFIILFTIYGAFLEFSGAGKFFIDFSLAAMGGKPSSAGRTVTLASFLLGGPSGSGVATTVTLGSVAYPMLAKAGYSKDAAGGLLSAGGIGAILSPPVLGAAAFLIAEFLKLTYLDVILMATIPTCLYYWSIFLMVELDAKKFGAKQMTFDKTYTIGRLTYLYGFHFLSLIAIVVIMLVGYTPILAVFWATVIAFAVSFIRKDTALYPRKLIRALRGGSIGVLSVASTCAAAGIIVGVVTLTGLGLKFSSIIISYAGGSLLLTAIYTALIVWVIGLAVPVTASYIISAVIAAPALILLGVPDYAAHMFVFYYAILSEVSPPTALSCFAAAALTGGNPYRTTLYAWKYTLPAFVVPFMFTLDPKGIGLLLKGQPMDVIWTVVTSFIGLTALAGGVENWLFKRTTLYERLMLIAGGLLLIYPAALYDAIGITLVVAVIASQKFRKDSPEKALVPTP
ncbi:MAG: C4-dicarboxylate ABC transporter permease [Desulfobacterales bacterium CG07_land_8_20_14_0_80_52_14]|nr:MAG: C4-dicarboxylate ABC transporter permease [Desulfobacterales bacterium CG07_land_8_20_14_0_80_52_14]